MELAPIEADALREIGEIGANAAAAAVSKLAQRRILVLTNQLHEVPARELATALGLPAGTVVGAATKVEGDLRGALLVAFPEPTARAVSDLLLGRPEGACQALGAMEQSALKEFANILSGAYLRTFADFLRLDAQYGVPLFATAGWDPLVRYTFLGTAPGAQHVWAVASRLDAHLPHPLHLFLLLDAKALDVVLAAVRAKLG